MSEGSIVLPEGETLAALPERYRGLAPDLRGYGGSGKKPLDATRGLRDFSDDLQALVSPHSVSRKSRTARGKEGRYFT